MYTMALAQPLEVRLKRPHGRYAIKIGSGNAYFDRGRKDSYDPYFILGKLKCHDYTHLVYRIFRYTPVYFEQTAMS